MDFRRKVKIGYEKSKENEMLETKYPHNIQLYQKHPEEDITLESLTDMVSDRLKVFRILENCHQRNIKNPTEFRDNVLTEFTKEKLKGYIQLTQGGSAKGTDTDLQIQARRSDHISHFILRLVYARSKDLNSWFITRELDLLRFKFAQLSTQEIKEFLVLSKLDFKPITEEEKNEIKDDLHVSTIRANSSKIEMLDFYRINFTEVTDLIRNRRCYVKGGYAYVNTYDVISAISTRVQEIIEAGLHDIQILLPKIELDERISDLVKRFDSAYTGMDYTVESGERVSIENIEPLSKKSFPLCMRMCHEWLNEKHHMKYFGREQYGRFLKGINVSMEDSLRFWASKFCKLISEDEFNKRYRYNIRHMYAKEGSMIDAAPYSCMKIINQPFGPQDCHGCPFKTIESVALKNKLSSYGIGMKQITEITSLSLKNHYQLACGKYFEVMHNAPLLDGITHPNQYYELSQMTQGKRIFRKRGRDQRNQQQNINPSTQNEASVSQRPKTSKTEDPNKTVWASDDDDDMIDSMLMEADF